MKKTSEKAGFSPGTLVHVGERKTDQIRITLMDYDSDGVREETPDDIETCLACRKTPGVTWINIDGLHDTALIEKIGGCFDIHPLILEDILHIGTRPKIEVFDTFIFLVMNMLHHDPESGDILIEQFSLILGDHFVLSFQERPSGVIQSVKERVRSDKSRIRRKGADYLTYALMDTVVDHYFIVLEHLGEEIENMEEALITAMDRNTFDVINTMKSKLISLRRTVSPLRELISGIQKDDSGLIDETHLIFFRDIHDHVIQIQETIDMYRELVSGLHDTFLANVNHKMNEIMKTLTITATLFIPLTFIAGIYGMNFKYMPELDWRWGYFAVWGLIVSVVGVMLYFFRKRDWL